jgi:hypothetical protein
MSIPKTPTAPIVKDHNEDPSWGPYWGRHTPEMQMAWNHLFKPQDCVCSEHRKRK